VNIPYIDIHTHHPVDSDDIIAVASVFLQDIDSQNDINAPFSAAIHPWHVARFTKEQISRMLENLIKQPGLIAIGETGLDKTCQADFQLQQLIFEMHIEFAEKHRKPLIIHGVKSWNELIVYIKRSKVPFILHGYLGGIELTKQLIDLGCYFSVGKSVLQITPRFNKALQIIPLSSLFLETDDSLEKISDIYDQVSATLNLPLERLKTQIKTNFETLFYNGNENK
jgi:TatD DNase family protein